MYSFTTLEVLHTKNLEGWRVWPTPWLIKIYSLQPSCMFCISVEKTLCSCVAQSQMLLIITTPTQRLSGAFQLGRGENMNMSRNPT